MKKWYKSPLTWGYIALCAVLLAFGFGVDRQTVELPVTENMRVRVTEDCDIYQLQCLRENASGGVVNADGSPLQKGEVFSWNVGTGVVTVTIAALDHSGSIVFETTLTHDFEQGPCTLLLTAAGFVAGEAA